MVKQILIIAQFCLLGQLCAGQAKIISIPVNSTGDTSYWYNHQHEKFAKIGISNLAYSQDSLVLRVSTEIQAVEIRTGDFETFMGNIYNFTRKYMPNSDQQSQSKLLFNKASLDGETAQKVFELFKKLSIDTIPSEQQIKRWPIGADGMSYIIEYATPSTYSFKSYWEPSVSRNSLKEAAAIDNFTKELRTMLKLYTSFDSFINSLPAGTYHAGGILLLTTKKKRWWKNR